MDVAEVGKCREDSPLEGRSKTPKAVGFQKVDSKGLSELRKPKTLDSVNLLKDRTERTIKFG